jgi:predicted RNA binding protein YcfA (HicA-like mRNA interferase family)
MNTKAYDAVKNGIADNNINFTDFQNLIIDLGFEYQRQEGSHIIYRHKEHKVKMNIQRDGNKAKGYQVRQLRKIITTYGL